MGISQKEGYPFGDSYNKDYVILESILRASLFRFPSHEDCMGMVEGPGFKFGSLEFRREAPYASLINPFVQSIKHSWQYR